MGRRLFALLALALALGTASPALAQSAPACQFLLGFAALHALISTQAGVCLENENHNPKNGDGLQHTTAGLMVWRKADNWTAFTDGYHTWINGPSGLQERLNSERFPWEAQQAARQQAAQQLARQQPAQQLARQQAAQQPATTLLDMTGVRVAAMEQKTGLAVTARIRSADSCENGTSHRSSAIKQPSS